MTDARRYRLGVIPGDGIGPEVTREAVRVLEAIAAWGGFVIDVGWFDLGAERYLRTGEVLPRSALDELASSDAILLGAVGDPRVAPGVLEAGLLLRLRQELDLYVNLRPARLFEGVLSPLDGTRPDDLDLVIVRENTEGLYAGRGEVFGTGAEETATELSINTAAAVERLLRYAFELSSRLGRSLTLVHKTNVLERAGGLYRRIFDQMSEEFPKVVTNYQHVDAAALFMVAEPRRFQVIVTDNLFGDILSDLAAALVGGIGLVGSGNIHPGRVSMFEPVHGSAPDIAGSGRANPIGAVAAAALLMRHLGETAAAQRIDDAIAATAGKVAADGLKTSEAGELILEEAL
jgi:3-isopropylmalate dehydrogenase